MWKSFERHRLDIFWYILWQFDSHLSYSIPGLSSVGQTNAPATGAVLVSVYGSSFGSSIPSSQISPGRTVCEASAWSSNLASSCKVSSGVGSGHTIDVDFLSLIVSRLLSYNAPSVQSNGSVGLNVPTSGSVSVTVIGAGFGLGSYTYRSNQGHTAFSSTNWVAESSVKSKSVISDARSISSSFPRRNFVYLKNSGHACVKYFHTTVTLNASAIFALLAPGLPSFVLTDAFARAFYTIVPLSAVFANG